MHTYLHYVHLCHLQEFNAFVLACTSMQGDVFASE